MSGISRKWKIILRHPWNAWETTLEQYWIRIANLCCLSGTLNRNGPLLRMDVKRKRAICIQQYGEGEGERCSPEGGDGGSELKARGTNAIYTLQFNAIYTLTRCNANWTVQFSAIDIMDQYNAIYTVQFNALPTDCHMMQIVQTQLRCKTDKTWFCSVFPTERLVSCC